MRLTLQITAFLVLGVFAVLAVEGYLTYKWEIDLLRQDTERDQNVLATGLRPTVLQAYQLGGMPKVFAVLDEINDIDKDVEVHWVWPDAPLNDPHAPKAPPEVLKSLPEAGAHVTIPGDPGWTATYSPMRLTSRLGAIEVYESRSQETHYSQAIVLRRVLSTLAITAVCGILQMIVGAWLVGRPVRRLVDKARAVGGGDLSGRLGLRRRDELGVLAAEMDAMADRLAESRGRVEAETRARIKALEQLRHADRLATVGTLASGIAHELGTPLQVVAARATMIASGETVGDEVVPSAAIISEQTGRITRIIRQLLDFTRKRAAIRADHALAPVLESTVHMLATLARGRGVELAMREQAGLRAEIDPAQLQQVITNLVMNAVQASGAGTRVQVDLDLRQAVPPPDHGGSPGTFVCLTVRDEGPGIAADVLPHVFEPFFTTKDVGEGTGLGLSVAYGMVREHDGWIEVESEGGRGTTFRVFLPPSGGDACAVA